MCRKLAYLKERELVHRSGSFVCARRGALAVPRAARHYYSLDLEFGVSCCEMPESRKPRGTATGKSTSPGASAAAATCAACLAACAAARAALRLSRLLGAGGSEGPSGGGGGPGAALAEAPAGEALEAGTPSALEPGSCASSSPSFSLQATTKLSLPGMQAAVRNSILYPMPIRTSSGPWQ